MKTILNLRKQIDSVDNKLIHLLAKRTSLAKQIGKIKKLNSLPAQDLNRWRTVIDKNVKLAKRLKIDPDLIKKIYALIHENSIKIQNKKT